MRLKTLVAALLLILATDASAVRDATPEQEQSLIKAWEAGQRADPKTKAFEEISPGVYHLRTERIPYDGKVTIHPVINLYGDSGMGMIEVTLDRPVSELMSEHPQSYTQWQQGNMFHFDQKAGRWVDWDEWREHAIGRDPEKMLWAFSLVPVGLGLLVLFLVVLAVRNSSLARKRMNEAKAAQDRLLESNAKVQERQQRILELTEEQTQLLRTIADALTRTS